MEAAQPLNYFEYLSMWNCSCSIKTTVFSGINNHSCLEIRNHSLLELCGCWDEQLNVYLTRGLTHLKTSPNTGFDSPACQWSMCSPGAFNALNHSEFLHKSLSRSRRGAAFLNGLVKLFHCLCRDGHTESAKKMFSQPGSVKRILYRKKDLKKLRG